MSAILELLQKHLEREEQAHLSLLQQPQQEGRDNCGQDLDDDIDRQVRPATPARSEGNQDGPAFAPRRLLWEDIKQQLNPPEWDEVRRILGSAILEKNEEVDREVKSLWSILADVQFQKRESQAKARNDTKPVRQRLSEPPGRQLIKSEISMFVSSFRERGKDIQQVLRPQSARERAVLNYISPQTSRLSGEAKPMTRPATAVVRPMTSLLPSPPSTASAPADLARVMHSSFSSRPSTQASRVSSASSHSSRSSSALNLVHEPEIQTHLNVFDIHKVTGRLREALQEEYDLLVSDVDYLNSCLEDLMNAPAQGEDEDVDTAAAVMELEYEPSTEELMRVRSQLKESWTEEETRQHFEQLLDRAPRLSAATPKSVAPLTSRPRTPSIISSASANSLASRPVLPVSLSSLASPTGKASRPKTPLAILPRSPAKSTRASSHECLSARTWSSSTKVTHSAASYSPLRSPADPTHIPSARVSRSSSTHTLLSSSSPSRQPKSPHTAQLSRTPSRTSLLARTIAHAPRSATMLPPHRPSPALSSRLQSLATQAAVITKNIGKRHFFVKPLVSSPNMKSPTPPAQPRSVASRSSLALSQVRKTHAPQSTTV